MAESASATLVALSRWIDHHNRFKPAEAVTWGRIAKLSEEIGEVVAEYILLTGQNPRKKHSGTLDEARDRVKKELLDVATTALGAYEHLDYHQENAIPRLLEHIRAVGERAGVIPVAVVNPVDDLTRLINDHHDLTHGLCRHGELRGGCTRGGY